MTLFSVSPKKEQELAARMKMSGIRAGDLEEKFIRSSGHGGQNINKTSTCVFLRHRPSGLSVKCQEERSRALNRYLARRRLVERMEEIRLGRLSAEQQRREKIRRQKRRRSRRVKAKMLAQKRMHAEKKALRGKVRTEGGY